MNVAEFFQYLLISIAGIFVIVNPLTTAFVFVSLLPRASEQRRTHTARRAVMISSAVLVTFALIGGAIFQLFGITLEAFRIAGGIILFGIAMGMIRTGSDENEGGSDTDEHDMAQQAGRIARDVSVIPLAIPFISGPGAIATVMILSSTAPSFWHIGVVLLAVLLATGTCYIMMVNSKYIVRYLGDTGKEIATKLFGLILAVIAVQFVINGVYDVYRKLPDQTASVPAIESVADDRDIHKMADAAGAPAGGRWWE